MMLGISTKSAAPLTRRTNGGHLAVSRFSFLSGHASSVPFPAWVRMAGLSSRKNIAFPVILLYNLLESCNEDQRSIGEFSGEWNRG